MERLAETNQPFLVALLVDIVRSRELGHRRADVQQELLVRVHQLNAAHGDRLLVPLSLSAGDEIQCLLRRPGDAPVLIDALDLPAREYRLRFALGFGDVQTDFRATTYQMDGGCFVAARLALEEGRRRDRWATARGFGEEGDRILDGLLGALQVSRDGWTGRQREAILRRRDHTTLKATAATMGIDPSTLSKMLKAAHQKRHDEAETALALLLDRLAGRPAEEAR